MENKKSETSAHSEKIDAAPQEVNVITLPGFAGVIVNRLMLFCFGCMSVFPIIIFFFGGPIYHLFLIPFALMMMRGYWRAIRSESNVKKMSSEEN